MPFTYAKRRTSSRTQPTHAPRPPAADRSESEAISRVELETAKAAEESALAKAEPLGRAVAVALLFPMGAVLLAAILFSGIRVHDRSVTTLAASTPASLRSVVVDQVLKADLTADRLKDAFGTTAAPNAALCTTQPLPPLPRQEAPPKAGEAAKREAARRIDAATAARARRDACRALLAARLSSDPAVQTLGQIIVVAIFEDTLSPGFILKDTSGDSSGSQDQTETDLTRLERALRDATTQWLDELEQDAFTKKVVAGANGMAGTMVNRTNKFKSEGSAGDPVETALGRVLSAPRLEAALRRGLTADVRPAVMGNGVTLWSKDVAARLTWATTAFVFCAAFAFVMTAAFGQLRQVEEAAAARWRRTGYLAIVVLAVLFVFVPLALGAQATSLGPLEEALIFFATRYNLDMRIAITSLDLIAVIGAVFLIVGSVATFLVEVQTAEEVKAQLSGLRTLFNAGAIFLLAGTLEVNALLRWPATFYPDPTGPSLIAAANWVATAVGAVFTIVLLAVYLPSVTILHEQVKWLPATEKANAETAFTAMGFGDAGIQQISRLLQALAPLLTGLTLTVASTI